MNAYRLVAPGGYVYPKLYTTLGRARIARTLLGVREDLRIEEITGDWQVVDPGKPELFGRLNMLNEWKGTHSWTTRSHVARVLRKLKEPQLKRISLFAMGDDQIAIETSDVVVYATPRGYYYAGFPILEYTVPGILMGKKVK